MTTTRTRAEAAARPSRTTRPGADRRAPRWAIQRTNRLGSRCSINIGAAFPGGQGVAVVPRINRRTVHQTATSGKPDSPDLDLQLQVVAELLPDPLLDQVD